MVHRLATPGIDDHAAGRAPMTASLRYRCACGDKDLLSIQVVFDTAVSERQFVETMKALFRDMQFEIGQHLKVQG
jgi:hypothetical protein